MSKKAIRKKSFKYLNLNLILLILIIITVFLCIYINTPEKKFVSNPSESVIMPAVNYVYKDISAVDAKKLIDKNLNNSDFLIIDVSLNYNEGHIINSVNYPIQDGSLESVFNSLDKGKTYLVYGRNEIDSLNAAKKLAGNGFENIYRLKGNYGTWVDMGYKIRNSY
jgi:rhodanese-related sulfurtransferase